jgi:hypothetical protein
MYKRPSLAANFPWLYLWLCRLFLDDVGIARSLPASEILETAATVHHIVLLF